MILISEKWKMIWAVVLCSCLSQISFGQQTWERVYGGAQYETASSVQQTTDGGYVVGGKTNSQGGGGSDMYLVKLDANGDTLWTKTYGDARGENINSLQQTADGGYILAGHIVTTLGTSTRNIFLVKTDAQGDVLWTKEYGDILGYDDANSIEQTTDGGYILGGMTGNASSNNIMRLIKTDAQGDTLWTKTYLDSLPIAGKVVHQTTDGGYIFGGFSHSLVGEQCVVVKTDAQGDTLWTYIEPLGPSTTVYDIQETLDGNYIVVGQLLVYPETIGTAFSALMLKLNAAGGKEWLGMDPNSTDPGFIHKTYYSVYPTADSAYIFAGTEGVPNYDAVGSIAGYQHNFLLEKRDSIGNLLWTRTFNGDYSYDLQETANGQIIVVGNTAVYGMGGSDMYVILTDSTGNYLGGHIEGRVYQDLDIDCSPTAGDLNLAGIVVQASLNGASSFNYYATTDTNGHYTMPCQPGTYTVSIPNLHPYYDLNCPQNTGVITAQPYDTIDFPLEVAIACPVMEVDASIPSLRAIVPSTYAIQYCNTGTESAQNVEITVELDSFLNVFNFSQAPLSQVGNTYTFNVGTVGIGVCDYIYITVQVDTTSILGQTHCIELSITPDSLCLPNIWTGTLLDVNGTCQNDSIFFSINNLSPIGTSTPRNYWVFEDNIIMRTGTVTVPNGGTSVVTVPAMPRKFYRIEVEQEAGIPWTVSDSIVSAFVEGCVPDMNGDFNVGFPTQFPNGHSPTFRAISCQENTGSFDPNNKEAQPVGYNTEHYINQNQYIDYQINFQNTGTDTAFFVTLIDTLSPHLEPSSIQLTSASHPYTWALKDNGVLEVKFDYIMLPDSNVNEPASHGFAKFRIQQKTNNAVGTIINNFADIYFDLNAPVRTNATYHEIGINFYILTIVPLKEASELKVKAFPNPFTYGTTIQVEGAEYDELTLMVYDIMGRQVTVLSESNSNQIELLRNNLESGVYVFKLLGDGLPISSGKIIAR